MYYYKDGNDRHVIVELLLTPSQWLRQSESINTENVNPQQQQLYMGTSKYPFCP